MAESVKDRLRDYHRMVNRLIDALPDSEDAGPAGTGYEYAWSECTHAEQEWVKQLRAEAEALVDKDEGVF